MKKFLPLLRKNVRTVVGVLSGTSVDAVDVVIVKISGMNTSTKIKVIDFESYPIDFKLKGYIIKCSSNKGSDVEKITKLNFVLGSLFADSVKKLISRNNLTTKNIDLIGSHGQTIYHFPFEKKLFGFNSKSTLQIGDPAVIANQTGITTIGDFRVADIAAGGNGAPLVSYLDFILFNHKNKNRTYVNIGGIANVTYLKRAGKQNEVIAFDTGPGNMLIDSLMKKLFNKKFDKDGAAAANGKVNNVLFKYLCLRDKFYGKNYPKSTGREYYGQDFVSDIIANSKKMKSEDIISTVTKFTSYTIHYNLKNFLIDELIISGGGAKNYSLINFLKKYFKGIEVKVIDENGINEDNKEAVLFAVLANELINGSKTNITSVTGSHKNVFLGKICLA